MKPRSISLRSSIVAGKVAKKIADLSDLKMPELWQLWDKHFLHRPSYPNRQHMEARLAYRLQELAYGGLSMATRDRLADLGELHSKIKVNARPVLGVLPGTRLLREFDGRRYTVVVLSDGRYEYQGQSYKSLSAIAKLITGTQWSGPAFFGLVGKKA